MKDKCPKCGAPMSADTPEGLCPRCLIALNLATQTEIVGEAAAGDKPPPAPPPAVAEVAKLFPQLEILECLGRGGMGAVYKARQPRLDRLVALKFISPEKRENVQFAERFEREARTLAKLHHPNIVTVYDFGEAQGNFYLLMEFVDGLTLRQLLRGRRLAPEEALEIVPKICEALQYAHEQGVVHRDIKPENILLDKDGRVKIADFGIAKIVGDGPGGNLTAEQVIGTPHYMSPEQIERPQTVDHRADIYSLGVVFYEMLTGELPLGKFQPPSKKVHIDVRLDEVVLRALEKAPERRYQHVSEVKTRLDTIAATAPGTSGQESAQNEGQRQSAPAVSISFGSILGWFIALGCAMLCACLLVLLGMSSDALGVQTWSYFRLGFEILAGTVFAGFLFVVYRAVTTNTPEARRVVKTWAPMMILMGLGILFGFWSPHLLKPKAEGLNSTYIGQTWFPLGDSIWIESVERNKSRMVVKGHYNLVSHDGASLVLYITTTNAAAVPTDSREEMHITKGNGDFELTHLNIVPSLPHVSMYADGQSFASIYFGTKEEAAEESRASWITNAAEAGPADTRLGSKVKYTSEQASVQDIVQSLAEQVGLTYDWQKSFTQTDPLCRQWVRNVDIEGETCAQALEQILKPVGLRYQVEEGVLVLSRQAKSLIDFNHLDASMGVWAVRFEPVGDFSPKTPEEFLSRIHVYSGQAGEIGYFRTTKQGDKLIGSFLAYDPDQLKEALAKVPDLRVTSVEKLTQEQLVEYEKSPQESF